MIEAADADLDIDRDGELSLARALFAPLPVVVESQRMPEEMPSINQAEAAQVAAAVRRRRVEFATARSCAHRAFGRLGRSGLAEFALRNDADRAPRWPAGIVGSITHTGPVPGGYCGVAVGRADQVRAIGFDAESGSTGLAGGGAPGTGHAGRVLPEELWGAILTARERAWVDRRKPGERAGWVMLIFSAKECFYKAQYPLSRRFLEFHDVEVEFDDDRATFEARLVRNRQNHPLDRCRGRYVRTSNLILTGIAIPV